MEKVRECGLMWSGEGTVQEWKVGIEEPFVTSHRDIRSRAVRCWASIEADLGDENTRRRRREAARQLTMNWSVALRRV